MRSSGFLILGIFVSPLALGADKSALPIYVQYNKTGRETWEQAEKLGQQETLGRNPCVSRMTRELEKFSGTKEMKEAVTAVLVPNDQDRQLKPNLLLHYLNESIEIRFELRQPQQRNSIGEITSEIRPVYRKGVVISERPGSWSERIKNGHCTVTEKNFEALINELREADRLLTCKARKTELLEASARIRNYLHSYMPVNWIDEARRNLSQQKYDVTGILREDASIYKQGNGSFRECTKGLNLLEEEAAASVRVLNEVKATKLEAADIPVADLEDLETPPGEIHLDKIGR